jgi:hypothetical protein
MSASSTAALLLHPKHAKAPHIRPQRLTGSLASAKCCDGVVAEKWLHREVHSAQASLGSKEAGLDSSHRAGLAR